MKPSRFTRVLIVGVGAALLGAAAATSGVQAPAQRAATPKSIVIGAVQPLSGDQSPGGMAMMQGIELAVHDINADGGIHALGGVKLRLATADSTSSDPNAATTAMSRVIDAGAVAIVGPTNSASYIAASTVSERAQIPSCTGAYSDQITTRGYRYVFQLPPKATTIAAQTVPSFLTVLKKLKLSGTVRVAVIYDDTPAGAIQGEAVAQALQESKRFNVVLNQKYPVNLSSGGPLVSSIKNANAQFIVTAGTALSNAVLIGRAMKEQGLRIPIFNTGGASPTQAAYAKALGKAANGQFVLPQWNFSMALSPKQAKLLAGINKRFAAKFKVAFMDQFAGEGYVCARVLAKAIEVAKSAEPNDIRNALLKTTFKSGPASLMPPGTIKFDSTGLNQSSITLVGEWCNGVLRTVGPGKYAAMPVASAAKCGG